MIRTRRTLAVVVTLALGLSVAACGSGGDEPESASSSGTPTRLDGTWELMNIATQGAATSLPDTVDAPTLEFTGGDVNVFTGCNSGSGTVKVQDSAIEFGPIALTNKACDEVSNQLETYVSRFLSGTVGYELDQGNLVLDRADSGLIFAKQ